MKSEKKTLMRALLLLGYKLSYMLDIQMGVDYAIVGYLIIGIFSLKFHPLICDRFRIYLRFCVLIDNFRDTLLRTPSTAAKSPSQK